MFFQNIGMCLQVYTVSQTRRPYLNNHSRENFRNCINSNFNTNAFIRVVNRNKNRILNRRALYINRIDWAGRNMVK
jgi:hypothetical protein